MDKGCWRDTGNKKKVEQPYSLRKNYILPSSMLLKGECSFGEKWKSWRWIRRRNECEGKYSIWFSEIKSTGKMYLALAFTILTFQCSVHRRTKTTLGCSSSLWTHGDWNGHVSRTRENGYSTHQLHNPRKSQNYAESVISLGRLHIFEVSWCWYLNSTCCCVTGKGFKILFPVCSLLFLCV